MWNRIIFTIINIRLFGRKSLISIMKAQILFVFFLFSTYFTFGQNVLIKTMPFLEAKQTVNLNDPNYRKSSIIFFLPIDTYDTVFWNKSVLNFKNKLKLKDGVTITIYKQFFDPGNCDKCGVKVQNKIDTLNYCSIYFPSCFISGYSPKLIDRAISRNVLSSYGFKLINSEFSISQITYKNSPICIEKPLGESDFDVWRPFIQEVFFPNYSMEETVEILLEINLELMTVIKEISNKIINLENNINVLKDKSETPKEIEKTEEVKKNKSETPKKN